MIKTLATAVALILTLSIATTAFAQNQTSGATGLQIQVVPQIQRGHQQHLTIFSVDDQGNEVNASEIQTTITNEKGNLVGPKTLYTNTGEDVAYKVGPNTRPQNITVDSCLTEQDLCATQSYYVFPKGQAQQPLPLPPVMPEPEPPVANNTGDGEIVLPANDTDVTTPEGGNETLPEQPVPELPPVANETAPSGNETTELTPVPPVPVTNETVPEQPEIPIEVNETIPIPIPSNETTGNETIPVPLPINETDTNQTVPIPELPVDPDVPPTAEAGNQTEELPVEIPAQNETDTIPIELPINSSTGNETIPIPPIEITPPTSNQTQNTTVEPEPLPGGETPNGTTPVEPEPETPSGNETTTEPAPEPALNTTQSFDQLENATAVLDQKLDEVLDNGNETNRGDLKALTGDALGAMGEVSDGFVDATTDQMLLVQQTSTSISESIDEILAADDSEGEDDQGEDEQ